MISRFSSEANSVINSPFISNNFVGNAVSNDVIYSEFITFLVSESPHPKATPNTIVERKRRLTNIIVDFLILFIFI